MAQYVDIVTYVAPTEASLGASVAVTINIKNISTAALYIHCVASVNGTRFINWVKSYVGVGQTRGFNGTFTMPGKDAVIYAAAYYQAADGLLYKDDETSFVVKLKALAQAEFRNLACSYGRA